MSVHKMSLVVLLLALAGCSNDAIELNEPVRGLRAYKVVESTHSLERRYPSVVQPHDETRLAFEVGGQLQKVDLDEGQSVHSGEVLIKLDPSTFQLHVQESEAGLAQATAAHRNASANFVRQSELWQRGVIPRSDFDDAEAAVDTARAQLNQATKRLEISMDNLAKTELKAPFDGVIASVEVSSYATVPPGQMTLTLYAENAFETEFTVPSSVVNSLGVGMPVKVLIADIPGVEISGQVTELGSRAAEVSAFPVVVLLDRESVNIKAGMSAEVVIDVALPKKFEGFLIPISCFVFNNVIGLSSDRTGIPVFVYDPDTGTVRERKVDVISVRGNMVIVHAGLKVGDLVASAGVSYLHDGQAVKLLESQ